MRRNKPRRSGRPRADRVMLGVQLMRAQYQAVQRLAALDAASMGHIIREAIDRYVAARAADLDQPESSAA